MLGIFSCRLNQEQEIDSAIQSSTQPVSVMGRTTLIAPGGHQRTESTNKFIPIYGESTQAGVAAPLLAELDNEVCDNSDKLEKGEPIEARLRLTLLTPFMRFPAMVTTSTAEPTTQTKIDIDTVSLSTQSKGYVPGNLVLEACRNGRDGVHTATLAPTIREWLNGIAPDCHFAAADAHGWNCELPSIDATLAERELTEIRRSTISRWTHKPYVLMRRLAITHALAQALKSDDKSKGLDRICRVIASSLPVELPATLTSIRWQAAVCHEGGIDRIAAAQVGLSKGLQEIEHLRQLFEKTSRLGLVTIRMPRDKVPSKDLWVSLRPAKGVTDSLVRETHDLAAAEGFAKACWHPIYAEDPNLMNLSNELELSGEGHGVSCLSTPSTQPPLRKFFTNPERYIAESITSETEFVVTNGHTKVLRLPLGFYSYTIHGLPENPADWEESEVIDHQTTGEIEWTKNRPNLVIQQWL